MTPAAPGSCSRLSRTSRSRRSRRYTVTAAAVVPVRAQVAGDGLPHHLRLAGGGQRDEVDAVRERAVQRTGRRDGQPRLADPARAGQRHQPDLRAGRAQPQAVQVGLPAHQRRGRRGQARRGAQALERRESLRQPGPVSW